MKDVKKGTPYQLPKNITEQVTFLAKVLDIKAHFLVGAGNLEVEAMCFTILYRHLNPLQRREAMKTIRAINNKALSAKLLTKALDTTFINPRWGVWSLTNKELLERINNLEKWADFTSQIGIGASFFSGKDLIHSLHNGKGIKRHHVVLLCIWGLVKLNNDQLKKAKTEKEHRSVMGKSAHHA